MMNVGARKVARILLVAVLSGAGMSSYAADNVNLNRLPQSADQEALRLAPLFNFTKKGCLPSPAISDTGEQNKGLKNSGSNTGGCQRAAQLDFSTPVAGSNTYHRAQCLTQDGVEYCAHLYALYFLKDQPSPGTGHRNDWEWALIWTTSSQGSTPAITYGVHSYHHTANIESVEKLSFGLDSHARFVYDQTGGTTHTMYFYPRSTDNFYNNTAVTPPIVDWYTMTGSGVTNSTLRQMLNTYDYGKANCPVNDDNFANNIVKAAPKGYPANVDDWKVAIQASTTDGSQQSR